MNKIPFDEKEFLRGAIAIDERGQERSYAGHSPCPTNCDFTTTIAGKNGTYTPTRAQLEKWTMKPTPPNDWIPVIDNLAPIEILGGREERLLYDGRVFTFSASYRKGERISKNIVAVRSISHRQASPLVKENSPKIEKKGIQTITEKEVRELQEQFLPKRKSSPPPITEIGQNETSRIAGEAMLGFKKGNIVKCDLIGRLMK